MTPDFKDSLARLERLSPSKLDSTSRRIRGEMAEAEWKMGLCLLALKRSGAFRKLGFGTLSEYSERVLRMSGRKVGSLLGAAEALEHLPLLSEAFREGRIGWSKVRVMHGLATPETEVEWLKFAEAHTSTEVERQVALSPRKWKRHRALKASIEGKPAVSPDEVREVLGKAETGSLETTVAVQDCRPRLASSAPLDDTEAGLPPVPLQTIRLVFEMTPDQYALYEQAESRIHAREGRRLPRSEVLKRMAETVLSQGTAKSRARHQVLVHTTEGSDEAWYDTERGVFPVSAEVLEKAFSSQEVIYVGSKVKADVHDEPITGVCPAQPGADSPSKDLSTTHSCDSPTKRTAIPNAIIRQVFARAGHRCECCGRKGGRLDIHHRDPVSEGGGHEMKRLELLCRACHTKNHEADFEERPLWRAARERASGEGRSAVLRNPSAYRGDPNFGDLAETLLEDSERRVFIVETSRTGRTTPMASGPC